MKGFAFFACLLCSVAIELPGNLRVSKRQEVAPGTPLYECHANCGDTILISRTDNYCSNSTFTSDLNACLECALTEDIWQYYGDDVASAAKSCSDNSTPSPSSASVATAAATNSVSTGTAGRITSFIPTTTGVATPTSLGDLSSTSSGSIASATSSSGSSPTSTAVASHETGAASSTFGDFTASIGVFLTIVKLLQIFVYILSTSAAIPPKVRGTISYDKSGIESVELDRNIFSFSNVPKIQTQLREPEISKPISNMAVDPFDSTQSADGYVEPGRQTTATLPPLPKQQSPVLHRLNCFIRLWLLKFIAKMFFTVGRFFFRPNSTNRPTLIKRYSCRPDLETRIFFPPDYYAKSTPGSLPLYLDIHGGGFAICDAQFDDRFCVSWAKRTGMLVVSLNYRKAPLHPFPTATYDVAAVVRAVLEDDLLPIDKFRVAIGGFSAGGNLALSASQLPGLKGIVKAVVAYYPVVDFGHLAAEKLAARPYNDGPRDVLQHTSWFFDWGYVSPGQNRRDPLLSPCYAKPEDLPPWIYIVGAQWDMLRLEAQLMMHRLAGLDDGVEHLKPEFEKGNYKWTMARGCSHGFTHGLGDLGDVAVPKETREKIYQEAHDWLKKSVLSD